jgi:hypothetical protein
MAMQNYKKAFVKYVCLQLLEYVFHFPFPDHAA